MENARLNMDAPISLSELMFQFQSVYICAFVLPFKLNQICSGPVYVLMRAHLLTIGKWLHFPHDHDKVNTYKPNKINEFHACSMLSSFQIA